MREMLFRGQLKTVKSATKSDKPNFVRMRKMRGEVSRKILSFVYNQASLTIVRREKSKRKKSLRVFFKSTITFYRLILVYLVNVIS